MASLNKAILIGNLGKDPEIRATGSGQSVATFSLATSEMEERTEWHNIVLWGKLAEIAAEYLVKGKSVYIEGRIQTRKWEGKDGQTRYTTEIVGETMKMLGGKEGSSHTAATGAQDPGTTGNDVLEDIPF